MDKRLAVLVLAAALCAAAVARAQTIPEGQSCGGLLCDMGMFGHKTEPAPPPPAVPVAPAPPAPAIKAAAPAQVDAEPRRHAPHPKKRILARRPVAPAPKIAAQPAAAGPSAAPVRQVEASPAPRPAAPQPAVAARATPPQGPFIFRSIDPALQ